MAQRRTVTREAQLDEDDVAWFKTRYPNASVNGTLSLLFKKFREVSEKHTSVDYAEIAAEKLTEEIMGANNENRRDT
jgi:hypothetical protein